jgi:hypothetical protein
MGYVAPAFFRASTSSFPSSDCVGESPWLAHLFSSARSVLREMIPRALAALIAAMLRNMLIPFQMSGICSITPSASESSINTIGTDRAMAIATDDISPMLEYSLCSLLRDDLVKSFLRHHGAGKELRNDVEDTFTAKPYDNGCVDYTCTFHYGPPWVSHWTIRHHLYRYYMGFNSLYSSSNLPRLMRPPARFLRRIAWKTGDTFLSRVGSSIVSRSPSSFLRSP